MLVNIDDALAFPKRFQIMTIAPRTLEGALSCDKICQWIFLSKDSDILDAPRQDGIKNTINSDQCFTIILPLLNM